MFSEFSTYPAGSADWTKSLVPRSRVYPLESLEARRVHNPSKEILSDDQLSVHRRSVAKSYVLEASRESDAETIAAKTRESPAAARRSILKESSGSVSQSAKTMPETFP